MTISRNLPQHDIERMSSFFLNAFIDYESARTLFIANKLLPATVLANTALEKYLKGYLAYFNKAIGKSHSIPSLLDKLKEIDPDFVPDYKISLEYAEMLSDIYETRYLISNLDNNNSYLISRNKHLAELDDLVYWLEHKVDLQNTSFKQNLNSESIKKNNFVLNNINKTDFIESPDSIYAMGIYRRRIIQVNVTDNYPNTKNDKKFKYPDAIISNKLKGNRFEAKANF